MPSCTDELVPAAILGYARRDAELVPVGKRAGWKERCLGRAQADIEAELVRRVRAGQPLRLKAGDPFIFGAVARRLMLCAPPACRYRSFLASQRTLRGIGRYSFDPPPAAGSGIPPMLRNRGRGDARNDRYGQACGSQGLDLLAAAAKTKGSPAFNRTTV